MNKQAKAVEGAIPHLIKADPNSPVLKAIGRGSVVIKGGTHFNGVDFAEDTPVTAPAAGYEAGADYGVAVVDLGAAAFRLDANPIAATWIGGFHFAPGGNASARVGGDEIPAINPCSLWDLSFRPACPDPRGMTLVEKQGNRFWCDIYLTGADCHVDGTSKFGAAIADGDKCPRDPEGDRYDQFDYKTAVAVMAHHGKGLLSTDEFRAAAIGVTERSACDRDPKTTGLDASRTSRFGLMQATGNLWVWGHDGDPDEPRASIFGGSWFSGDHAGSRDAYVGYWPENSSGLLGARGRSDHLQPV